MATQYAETVLRPERTVEQLTSPDYLEALTERLARKAEHYDRTAEFPRENFDILAAEGLIGLTVAPELGGRGAKLGQALKVLGAVAKGEPSTALILFMTYAYHAASAKTRNWPRGLYEQVAREAAAGRGLIGVFRVEPELGTPVRGGLPETTARRTADGWALSGTKIYSTGSTGLDWYAVWARTDEEQPRVGLFLVPAGTPNVVIEPVWDHLGMRATVSHAVHFTGTPVRPRMPWTCVCPATGQARRPIPARPCGMRWLSRRSTMAPRARRATGSLAISTIACRPISAHPSRRCRACRRSSARSRRCCRSTARSSRRPPPAPMPATRPPAHQINNIKHVATTNAIRAVEIGLELTGNPGISRKNPLERHYRDVLCSRIHSPQADTILVAAGKAGLGA